MVASLIEASGGTLIFDDNPHGRGLRVTTGWPTLFPSDARLTEPRSADTIYRSTVEWSTLHDHWDDPELGAAKSRRWSRTRKAAETR